MAPNRVVAISAAVLSLVLGALPVIVGMDWQSTAGIIAGITALLGYTLKWLTGWQAYEERESLPLAVAPAEPDRGDAGAVPSVPTAPTPVPPPPATPTPPPAA